MLFNSYIFIFMFLPITLVIYFILCKYAKETFSKMFLVGMSLWFYAYFNCAYVFVIVISIVINYLFSSAFTKIPDRRNLFLTIGIIFNIALIFVFKYLDFSISNFNLLFKANLPLVHILMPLGISFFTFQQIGFLIDSFNGEIENHSFLEYSLFVSFFPQLIAGPIVSMSEMLPQFRNGKNKHFDYDNFSIGIYYFVIGLGKKVLIADTLGITVDYAFSNYAILTGPEVILSGMLYTFQLYFDFSGYCDMACGIGKMFNVSLPVNFLSPLKSCSVMEFWDKWHITLGRFLQKYVFTSMAMSSLGKKVTELEKKRGHKKSKKWANICLFLTFVISGIWHGANWTFILWGCIQGIGRVLYQIFRKDWNSIPKFIRWIINFMFTVFSMTLFRAPSIEAFGVMLSHIRAGWRNGFSSSYLSTFSILELTYVEEHIRILEKCTGVLPYLNMMLIVTIVSVLAFFTKNIYERKHKFTSLSAVGIFAIFSWSLISLSNMATFLYFNF